MVGLKKCSKYKYDSSIFSYRSHPEIEKLDKELPVVRDPDSSSYLRQEGKGFNWPI